ncbi:HAMP domain-containing sensor histidine kinase [Bacillus swezeyi]|uniref:histidine kinase n=1 Tax=Bacillus swezeyi TaxID=1925020 RepID=A0A1R1QFV1_9BACI|nr:HAMP domain-containing sensor histidine kinase [Bacillus swezeyi]MEC1260234.1 HAMP domain-containing sensor histidine kinase [Bacillus swezeyi]MED2929841.1 HAMP domain-containing sensor histidine kinase [Bacillus swezeyi]MED2964745.1 HAMP domain-containing sensor histidine kinase [Bacillus swezeyi]MED3072974.1 HAMP domain-containing sensor histidine kinase [Bacillus swezeyi]MED3083011.1 HAMP domain-containing sensor histidine kinase [Bacillus swezeyi]
MGVGKRKKTLRKELIKYMVTLSFSLIAVTALYVAVNTLGMNAGLFYPANYYEHKAEKLKPLIQSAERIEEGMIPDTMRYAVLDKKSKQKTAGNIKESDLPLVRKKIGNKPYVNYKQKGYLIIERKDEYCVLEYSMRAEFRSSFLRKYFPNYELTSLCIMVILLMTVIFIVTTLFANRLKKHFETLNTMAKHIKKQNLHFTPEFSNIKEFDHVIDSLIDMRDALKASLQAQWHLEKTKKEQIGALAHDIKIPMTIIKGNAELLSLSPHNQEQSDYIKYILDAGDKIDQYIDQLIHLSKTEETLHIELKRTKVKDLVESVLNDTAAYLGSKDIEIVVKEQNLEGQKTAIDIGLLHRALMNILSNAADYTPQGGKIVLEAACTNDTLIFTITDSGKGFSPEGLKKAAQLFYMEDKSRTSNGHYGMGLTFALSVVKLHQGDLAIKNAETGGGQVSITIPLFTE